MRIDNYLVELDKSKLFSSQSQNELLKIFNSINYKISEYYKGQVIHNEEDLCECLSIILVGNIEIQKIDAMGKTLTVAEFSVGDTFGENLIFSDNLLYPMTVFSKTESIVLEIQKESVSKLCQLNTHFMNEFLNTVSNRALGLSSKLKEISLKTIRQKICEFLLIQYTQTGKTKINLGMSKKIGLTN